MKSYASLKKNFSDTLSEFWHVYRHKTDDIAGTVAAVVDTANRMEKLVDEQLGFKLGGRELLEIGAGQQLLRLKYFGTKNRVTAIDYDIVTQGFDLGAYWRVLRHNGAKRFVKTVLRKAAGIDRAYWKELERHAGIRVRERMNVVRGDAHSLPWSAASFDFVYSFSVFEHLTDPSKCLVEVVRVLKPGGAFCISTHMYSSDSGAHDPRTFNGQRDGLSYWAHLRPDHRHESKPNAFCNKLKLAEWEKIFRDKCPGVSFKYMIGGNTAKLKEELVGLRAAGELKDYTDDELLTVDLWAFWKKPE